MTIGEGVQISRKAHLDYTHPKGVHIGDYTIITPGAIILPGVTVEDHCVIA